jgi:hypothetical protein
MQEMRNTSSTFESRGPSIAGKSQPQVMKTRCEFTTSEADCRPVNAVFLTVLNREKKLKTCIIKDTFLFKHQLFFSVRISYCSSISKFVNITSPSA